MQGIGNDFIVVDTLQEPGLPSDLAELSRKVNDRHRGIGGDGLILIEKGVEAPFRMRFFNPDGSEGEMCGNGVRCFAILLREHGHLSSTSVDVETGAGVLKLELTGGDQVRVDMGQARLKTSEIGMKFGTETFVDQNVGGGYVGTAVSMGNPHLVIFVEDISVIELERVGPIFETHPYFPQRVNVHFAQVLDREHLAMRTWERGAGVTLACGTGACAVGVAAFITGRAERKTDIKLPGGHLEILYLEDGHVLMTGPGTTVFTSHDASRSRASTQWA